MIDDDDDDDDLLRSLKKLMLTVDDREVKLVTSWIANAIDTNRRLFLNILQIFNCTFYLIGDMDSNAVVID